VRAQFVVACDGAGSSIRRTLGIAAARDSDQTRARLAGRLRQAARAAGAYSARPGSAVLPGQSPPGSFLGSLRRSASFGASPTRSRTRSAPPLRMCEPPIADALECAVEAVEVFDTREWSGDAVVAESFRSGHVLLAGDAAHRMWPSGGHGMNTGLGERSQPRLEAGSRVVRLGAGLPARHLHRRARPHCERMVRRAWHNYRADNAILPEPTLDDPGQRQARKLIGERIVSTRHNRVALARSPARRALSRVVRWSFPTAPPSRHRPRAIRADGATGTPRPTRRYATDAPMLDLFRGRFTLLKPGTYRGQQRSVEAFPRSADTDRCGVGRRERAFAKPTARPSACTSETASSPGGMTPCRRTRICWWTGDRPDTSRPMLIAYRPPTPHRAVARAGELLDHPIRW